MNRLSRDVCMSSWTCTHYFKLKSDSLNIPRSSFFMSAFSKVCENCKMSSLSPSWKFYAWIFK